MKKRFTAVTVTALVCWMIIASPAWAQTVNDLKLGDADGDGKTDINDALAVALYDCGMKTQNDMAGFTMADADCSGKVDIFDALKIAEFDAGIVQTLDCSGCVEPSAPVGLGAVETEDMTSVNISWNAVPWAESYRLYRDASSDGSFTEEIYAGSDTSYTEIADSECGINCYYRVLAENTCGQSAKSDYASVESYSACSMLYIPTGFTAAATDKTSVKISWNTVFTPGTYYLLYRDTSAAGSFDNRVYRKLYEWGVNPMSYTDTNLQCGTTYYYRISTANECSKQTKKSAPVSAVTYSCCVKPSVPLGLNTDRIGMTVKIYWFSGESLTGVGETYRLYRDTSATGSFTQEIYSGSTNLYIDNNMQCETTYYYKVLSEKTCGQSEKSAYVSAMITKPTNILLSADSIIGSSGTVCQLSWLRASWATGYKLYKDTSATGSFTQLLYSGSNTYYSEKIFECGKTYYYKLVAENACGQSSSNASYSLNCCITNYVSAPGGLTITEISSNSLNINWNPVSNPSSLGNPVSYSLYRGESLIYSGSATSYIDKDVNCGNLYYYSVSAVSECGISYRSSYLYVKTNPCVRNSTGAKTD